MPNLYVVLRSGEEAWVLEWSTTLDAPIGTGVPLNKCDRNDPQIARALRHGTSADIPEGIVISGEANIVVNRAGKDETILTIDQIIEAFCRARSAGEPPRGYAPWEHSKQENEAFVERQYADLRRRGLDWPLDLT